MTEVFTRGARAVSSRGASLDNCGLSAVSPFGLTRLLRSRGGNVSMMYALVAPVLVFGGGAAIDYGRAAQIHTNLTPRPTPPRSPR